jgi:hypothetical protein
MQAPSEGLRVARRAALSIRLGAPQVREHLPGGLLDGFPQGAAELLVLERLLGDLPRDLLDGDPERGAQGDRSVVVDELLDALAPGAYRVRRAVVTGRRAARMAGRTPPRAPIPTAQPRPWPSSAGVTLRSKATWEKVLKSRVESEAPWQ